MSTSELIRLFHHRWSAPILAELVSSRGARFVVLANRLGVGRETLRRTLDALIELGFVRRNPGHGHPLRPEYVLTRRGHAVADRCARLLSAIPAPDVALKKWSMPAVAALGSGRRFSELRAALPGVSGRALALALKDLQAAGIVERDVLEGYPPSTVYSPTPLGRRLQRTLDGTRATPLPGRGSR